MRRIWYLLSLLLLLPAICHSGEYVLVMSKNDCLCEHMLKLYNTDIEQYGQVKYEHHKEFNWVKWEHKKISMVDLGGVTQELTTKIVFCDINNDSRDEVIVYSESRLYGSPMDVYDIFNYDDVSILNEIVDGRVYYN